MYYYYYRYYHIIMTFTQAQIYEISCRKRLILDEILKRKYFFFSRYVIFNYNYYFVNARMWML